jgi:hypothetical protein
MEKHFLNDIVEGQPEFKAEPWYNHHGDCVVFQMANEAVIGDRVDEILTVYRSAVDQRPIGYQIKGIAALISKFGVDGLLLESETTDEQLQSVSITALLLAAYEGGPKTFQRRLAYANAMRKSEAGIPRSELVPA